MRKRKRTRLAPKLHFFSGSPANLGKSELDRLFASCMPKLARAARHMLRNTQDSEDILQESLLSAFLHLHQFQNRAKFSTWIYSIMRNAAKMHLRKLASYRFCPIEWDGLSETSSLIENASDPHPNAEESYAHKERSEILKGKVSELPPAYQAAIQLCYIEGLDQRHAAVRLGVALPTLKTRLHRARHLISKKIRKSHRP